MKGCTSCTGTRNGRYVRAKNCQPEMRTDFLPLLHTVSYGAEKLLLVWQDLEKRSTLTLLEHELSFQHKETFHIARQQFHS